MKSRKENKTKLKKKTETPTTGRPICKGVGRPHHIAGDPRLGFDVLRRKNGVTVYSEVTVVAS